jgi:hypothetical protein
MGRLASEISGTDGKTRQRGIVQQEASMHHEIVMRRAQVAVTCQCPCHEPGRTEHEGCAREIAAHELVIDHIDDHGHTSSRCEFCGALADEG